MISERTGELSSPATIPSRDQREISATGRTIRLRSVDASMHR